jgi:ABC-type transport system involved in multi-copper enzyme maturation permease subunit
VIVAKTWREIRGMVIAYAVILEVLMVPAILLWPEIERETRVLARLIPGDFMKRAFEAMASTERDGDISAAYSAYMAVQLFFKGVNVVGIAGAVLLGTGLIARERENMTFEYLLSRPVSRSRILWSKFWPTALAIVIPIFLTSWSALPLSRVPNVDEHLRFEAVTMCCVHSSAFVLFFLAFTTMWSVRLRSQVHVAFVVGGFTILQVCVFFIQVLRKGSLFRLSDFDVYGPIMAGNVRWSQMLVDWTIWPLLGAAICYAIADRWMRTTDL